ncbi:MAG: 4Fe-4S binding protein [Bacteroidales bacterium]|nr:4Fe-4S binding protein [Bacteroidales bacterium]HPD94792.1 NADH-ubiquinone oxidoreductase-F iron-sulfur binding region domain-containing protein [Tenuifilaceae bacterium]HRX30767.1 NADH-ubiquinone oxidoreductase-F iron-sulfur binding region domain-containing protein [Tenuifilaceae bacterium]
MKPVLFYKEPEKEQVINEVIPYLHDDLPDSASKVLSAFRNDRVKIPIVYVGLTTSSEVGGARKTIEAIEKYIDENELDAKLVIVGSHGLCSYEPIVEVQLPGKTRVAFGKVTENAVPPLLDGIFNGYALPELSLFQYSSDILEPWAHIPLRDELPFFANQQRVLLKNAGIINPENIIEYIAYGGYRALAKTLRKYTSDTVCRLVEESELRGRGGGGFLTGKKWRAALEVPANERILICNADESDPGAFMDRLLIESDPQRVIEGIILSAYAIGASKALIYIRNLYSLTTHRIEEAIRQAYDFGLLGYNILDSGYSLDIVIRKGPGAYVCGEETALIKSLEGKRGMPSIKPPFPTEHGYDGKPTVVNNVETIANIPDILLNGVEWFTALGTEKSKGTKMFSVSGKSNETCFIEVEMGKPLSVIYDLANGVKSGRTFKALHLGGPSGVPVTPEELEFPIGFEELQEHGIPLGSGGVQILDDTVCMVDLTKYFMHFIRNESCGKCIPCREGSNRMYKILDNISRRPYSNESHNTLERFKGVIQLETLAEVMRDTSLCGLGQTASKPLLKALKSFRDEFEEHIFDRKCRASVCRDLRTFYIDVDKCTGCTACARKCPTKAIFGTPRSPYFVVEEKCIGCGICMDTCKFSAVYFK